MLSLLSVLVYTIGMFHHHHGTEVVLPLAHTHTVYCHHAESGTSSPASGAAHGICPGQQQLALFQQNRISLGRLPVFVRQMSASVCLYILAVWLMLLCVTIRRFAEDRSRWRPCLIVDTGRGWRAPPVC